MKKYIFSLAIAALLFSGCGDKKSNEHSHEGDAHEHTTGTHEHEDGSVHTDHQDAEHHQEEFKVGSDTTTVKTEKEHGHSHEDGSHKH
jgi:PBP1b-binding outer membrane lipoprotein LpoB